MKYQVNNLQTEFYRLAWDYYTDKINFETMRYVRHSIEVRYPETHEEIMTVWWKVVDNVQRLLMSVPTSS